MVSHISHVELGSPAEAIPAPLALTLRADMVLLAADTALAPLVLRIPVGARLVWCILVGRVERDEMRLWCLDEPAPPADEEAGIPIPFGTVEDGEGDGPEGYAGPWLINSAGSDMGIRILSWVYAVKPPNCSRLEMARAYDARYALLASCGAGRINVGMARYNA